MSEKPTNLFYKQLEESCEGTNWLQLNAKLQQKKNKVRALLNERGIQPKDKSNDFDRYKYFSEAGYKRLFTELFSEVGLELQATTKEYVFFEGSDKQPNGRQVDVIFRLHDTETGFFEESVITGEGLDKGDKAGYKAYTGALKYYFAETFNVATGDDPETESPEARTRKKPTMKMLDRFRLGYSEAEREMIRKNRNLTRDEDLPYDSVDKYLKDRKELIDRKEKERDERATNLFEIEEKPFY